MKGPTRWWICTGKHFPGQKSSLKDLKIYLVINLKSTYLFQLYTFSGVLSVPFNFKFFNFHSISFCKSYSLPVFLSLSVTMFLSLVHANLSLVLTYFLFRSLFYSHYGAVACFSLLFIFSSLLSVFLCYTFSQSAQSIAVSLSALLTSRNI